MAAAAVLLAACGGGDEPGPDVLTSSSSPSSPSSPSSSSSSAVPAPEVTVPPLPPEATTQDAAGAEAFVRHWFDLLNYGYMTGDSGPLSHQSDDACAECGDFFRLIEDLSSDDERTAGPAIGLDAIAAPPPAPEGVLVSVAYHENEVTVIAGDGSSRRVPAGKPVSAGAILSWAQGGWTMIGIGSA